MAATTRHVAGPCLLRISSPSTASLEDLGYSRNGVDIVFRTYTEGIPSDLNGGELGPPIDVQYFGETADIRFQLTTYDTTAYNKIQAVVAGATAGTPSTAGTLFFAQTKDFRLLISSASATPTPGQEPMNFPRVIWQGEREINKGSRFSQAVLSATAYKNDSGVLYNATTS